MPSQLLAPWYCIHFRPSLGGSHCGGESCRSLVHELCDFLKGMFVVEVAVVVDDLNWKVLGIEVEEGW